MRKHEREGRKEGKRLETLNDLQQSGSDSIPSPSPPTVRQNEIKRQIEMWKVNSKHPPLTSLLNFFKVKQNLHRYTPKTTIEKSC